MSLDVQEIVSAVASRLNVDNPTAENAVGTILSILDHEAAGTKADALFDELPGARDLAQRYDVMNQPAGGGLMGMLGSALGDRAGALINGMERLKGLGLTVAQVEAAGQQLVEQAKTAAGPDTVNEVINDVPGLAGRLGL
ncbi:MAG: hypothetical protein ACTHJV_05170 [Rhizobiaceae bacterium]